MSLFSVSERLRRNLRDEQERVQKKTFTNWINTYLCNGVPPTKITDLFTELKDGVHLLHLLEILSGTTLPKENRRIMQRIHCLSNIKTSLEFMESKKIKLVNINPADVCDGKPTIILGLIWTIILYFQIEEQEDMLLKILGMETEGKVKGSARKAMLSWVEKSISETLNIPIKDFGPSWRDGRAFNALVANIRPELIDMSDLPKRSNKDNLDGAFKLAEEHLGIPQILDAEDVDVDKPDEKSIMTYVAQFLKAYPEGGKNKPEDLVVPKVAFRVESQEDPKLMSSREERLEFEELKNFVNGVDRRLPAGDVPVKDVAKEYEEFAAFLREKDHHCGVLRKLSAHAKVGDLDSVDPNDLPPIEKAWDGLERRVQQRKWALDSALTGDAGVVGKWLARAEKCLTSDWPDLKTTPENEIARVMCEKLKEHRNVFKDRDAMEKLFGDLKSKGSVRGVPEAQLVDMGRRLSAVLLEEPTFRVRLEYMEMRYRVSSLVAECEQKLDTWTQLLGEEEDVQRASDDYQKFVVDAKLVDSLYENVEQLTKLAAIFKRQSVATRPDEAIMAGKVSATLDAKWPKIAKELNQWKPKFLKILTTWEEFKRHTSELENWFNDAEPKAVGGSAEERKSILQDLGRIEKMVEAMDQLGTIIKAQCRDDVGDKVRMQVADMQARWRKLNEKLEVVQKKEADDEKAERKRDNYLEGVRNLCTWMDQIEALLGATVPCIQDDIKDMVEQLDNAAKDIGKNTAIYQAVFKGANRLIQDGNQGSLKNLREEVSTLKERLDSIQREIPRRCNGLKNVLDDVQSIEMDLDELEKWIGTGELLRQAVMSETNPRQAETNIKKEKDHFANISQNKSLLNAKNKTMQNIETAKIRNLDCSDLKARLKKVNDRMNDLVQYETELESSHQKYHDSFHAAELWLANNVKKLQDLDNTVGDRKVLGQRLDRLKELLSQKPQGEAKLEEAIVSAKRAMQSEGPGAQQKIRDELEGLEEGWEKFITNMDVTEERLKEALDKIDRSQGMEEHLENWMKAREMELSRTELGNTVQEKKDILNKVKHTLDDIHAFRKEVEDFAALSEEIVQGVGKSHSTSEVMRYQNMLAKAETTLQTCEQNVQDHEDYNAKLADCVEWMGSISSLRQELTATATSKAELDRKKKAIDDLQDARLTSQSKVEQATIAGESLYSTTGPAGCTRIRQELKELKVKWDALYEEVGSNQRQVEVAMSQLCTLDEELHRMQSWLDQTEKLLQESSADDGTLDSKRSSAQKLASLLQDIEAHDRSMGQLSDRAVNLGDEEEMKLAKGLQSRYANLLDKAKTTTNTSSLELATHESFQNSLDELAKWMKGVKSNLSDCNDMTGNKNVLKGRLDKLRDLDILSDEAEAKLALLDKLARQMDPDSDAIKEVTQVRQQWQDYITSLKKTKGGLETCLGDWSDFDSDAKRLSKYIKNIEEELKRIDLKGKLPEKKDQHDKLQKLCAKVSEKEKEFENLVANATVVAKSSGDSSASKTAVQLSSRFKSVKDQGKDLTGKWLQYVTDHEDMEKKRMNASDWLHDFHDRLKTCTDKKADTKQAAQTKIDELQRLRGERDKATKLISDFKTASQIVIPNTSSSGCDLIKKEIAELQELWNSCEAMISAGKSKSDTELAQLTRYDEGISQLERLISEKERTLEKEKSPLGTLSEKKARTERLKGFVDEVTGMEGNVKSVSDKARELRASDAEEKANNLMKRYLSISHEADQLLEDSKRSVVEYERYKEAFDNASDFIHTADEEILRSLENRGNKDSVQEKLARIHDLENQKFNITSSVKEAVSLGENVMSSSSRDGQGAIKSDLRKLQEDMDELFSRLGEQKDAFSDMADKWGSLDEQIERLNRWLDDAESKYNDSTELDATLSEKRSHLSSQKTLHSGFQDMQTDFDRLQNNASNLLEKTPDLKVSSQLSQIGARFGSLLHMSKDYLSTLQQGIEDHQQYDSEHEKALLWLKKAHEELKSCLASTSSKDEVQSQLRKLHDLTIRKDEGHVTVESACSWADRIIKQTGPRGKEPIKSDIADLSQSWEEFLRGLDGAKSNLEGALVQWSELDNGLNQAQKWIKDTERKLKESELKYDLNEKTAQLQKLMNLRQNIDTYGSTIDAILTKSKCISPSPEHQSSDAKESGEKVKKQYENLRSLADKKLKNCEATVAQHQTYQENLKEFYHWLHTQQEKLAYCQDTYGDIAALEGKMKTADELAASLGGGHSKLATALQEGDQTLTCTSQSGQSHIRQEMDQARQDFDTFQTQLTEATTALEKYLQISSDFHKDEKAFSQWLKDKEGVLHKELDLQSNVVEKKQLLDQWVKHHHDILAHQTNLDAVIEKANQIFKVGSDSGVSQTLAQLRSRYQGLVGLSNEIVRRLECHHSDHANLNRYIDEFYEWVDIVKEKLERLKRNITTKRELDKNMDLINELDSEIDAGYTKVKLVQEWSERTVPNTSQRGAKSITDQVRKVEKEYDDLGICINIGKEDLTNTAAVMKDFDRGCQSLSDWLNECEEKITADPSQFRQLSERKLALERLKNLKSEMNKKRGSIDQVMSKARDLGDEEMEEDAVIIASRASKLNSAVDNYIDKVDQSISGQEEFKAAYTKASDWLSNVQGQLQVLSDLGVGKKDLRNHYEQLTPFMEDLNGEGKAMMDTLAAYAAQVKGSGSVNAGEVTADAEKLRAIYEGVIGDSVKAKDDMGELLRLWGDFSEGGKRFTDWTRDTDDKLKRVGQQNASGLEDTQTLASDYQVLHDNIAGRAKDLNRLIEQADQLHRLTQDPEVAKQITQYKAQYDSLMASCKDVNQKLAAIAEEQQEFEDTNEDAVHWIEVATSKLLNCSDFTGNPEEIQSKLRIAKEISDGLDDGEAKFLAAIDSGERVLKRLAPGKGPSEKVQGHLDELKGNWTELNQQLGTVTANLNRAAGKWVEYEKLRDQLAKWLEGTEKGVEGVVSRSGRPDPAENKAMQEKFKAFQKEIERKAPEFCHLQDLCDELSGTSHQPDLAKEARGIQDRYKKLRDMTLGRIDQLNRAENDHQSYKDALAEAEKWILQTSFRVMDENASGCSSIECAQAKVDAHDLLLRDIDRHRRDIDNVTSLGGRLADEYRVQSPEVSEEILRQLESLEESYTNLKATAEQTKSHLADNLKTWQTYRDLVQKANQFFTGDMPRWWTGRERPVAESVEDANAQLTGTKEIVRRINEIRDNIASAAHRCEAAAYGPDRPPSLTTNLRSLYPSLPSSVDGSEGVADSDLIKTVEKIDRQMKDNMDKLDTRVKGLQEAKAKWEAYVKDRDRFKEWVDAKYQSSSHLLDAVRTTSQVNEDDRQGLEDLLHELRNQEESLKTLVETQFQLTRHKSTSVVDPTLRDAKKTFEEMLKLVHLRLQQRDKTIEAAELEEAKVSLVTNARRHGDLYDGKEMEDFTMQTPIHRSIQTVAPKPKDGRSAALRELLWTVRDIKDELSRDMDISSPRVASPPLVMGPSSGRTPEMESIRRNMSTPMEGDDTADGSSRLRPRYSRPRSISPAHRPASIPPPIRPLDPGSDFEEDYPPVARQPRRPASSMGRIRALPSTNLNQSMYSPTDGISGGRETRRAYSLRSPYDEGPRNFTDAPPEPWHGASPVHMANGYPAPVISVPLPNYAERRPLPSPLMVKEFVRDYDYMRGDPGNVKKPRSHATSSLIESLNKASKTAVELRKMSEKLKKTNRRH